MAWVAEGVHYRCLDSARRRDAVGLYTARAGKLTERYVLEMVASAHREALERDLTEMVGRRPKQLRRSIDAMKPDRPGHAATLRFEHLEPGRIARFWPLIVMTTPLHWSPVLEEFLAPAIAELGGRGDIEALDVLAIEDLEALVAITEQTGRRLSELLAAKQETAGAHADVRSWLARDRSIPNIARPTYLDTALSEAMDLATRLLGFDGIEDGTAA